YTKHPYKRPIIGYDETIRQISRKEIVEFYRNWYVANNMVLVITGDFNTEELIPHIKARFSKIPSNPKLTYKTFKEPKQTSLRLFVTEHDISGGYLNIAFHAPPIGHNDSAALRLLGTILGGGESSRLHYRLKNNEKLVDTIDSFPFFLKDPGLFFITSTLHPEKIEYALEEIFDEVYRLRDQFVREEELEKAKVETESTFIYARETIQGLARKLGYYEVVMGDVYFEDRYLERIRHITKKDISKVAQKYLYGNNATIGIMIKNGSCKINTETVTQLVGSYQKKHSRKTRLKQTVKDRGITLHTMHNGIRVLLKSRKLLPIMSIKSVFLGGLRFEDTQNNGIFNLMTEMLTKGTENLKAQKIAQQLETSASVIYGFSGWNSFGLSGEALSNKFDLMFDIFSDIIVQPSFDTEEVDMKKEEVISAILRQEDNLTVSTFNLFVKNLYNGHPYGMNLLGKKETVSLFERKDLLENYKRYAVPQNMVISIVGDINETEVLDKISEKFEVLPKTELIIPNVPKIISHTAQKKAEKIKDKKQTHIIVGFLSPTIKDQDRHSMEVLNTVLSRQGGRLFINIRDKLGLAYTVTSFLQLGIDPGYFGIYIATSPEKEEMAIEAIMKELKHINENSVTTEEIIRAKMYMIGNFEKDCQTISSEAVHLAFYELYGLGYREYMNLPNRISGVTKKSILEAAQKYIDITKPLITILR
ncbi:MAG: pitrilysin family protein, partial [Thermodesulfobacteriota bacterium]|nr:pitrilysin family protein [Thermodesulfobacteriota bacterium]